MIFRINGGVGLCAVSTNCGQNQCCCRCCRLLLVYTGAMGKGVLSIYVWGEKKLIYFKNPTYRLSSVSVLALLRWWY